MQFQMVDKAIVSLCRSGRGAGSGALSAINLTLGSSWMPKCSPLFPKERSVQERRNDLHAALGEFPRQHR